VEELSLREELEKAYEADHAEESEVSESAPIEAPAETTASAEESARARDERGRFAAKQNSETEQTSDQPPAEKTETAPPSIEAPRSWSAEKKALWNSLPPELQEYVLNRENETHNKIVQLGDEKAGLAREVQSISAVLSEPSPRNGSMTRKQEWALKGLSPDAGVRQLIEAQDYLEANPVPGILWLCQSLGVHPSQLMQAQPRVDPAVAALQREVQELRGQHQQGEEAAQSAYLNHLSHAVEVFASEKDESGALRRPHFADVEARLEPFIVAARQGNPTGHLNDILQEAYDAAVYSVPTLRQKQLEHHKTQVEANLQVAQKAAAAKRASSSLTGAPSASLVANPPDSLRGLIEAAWDGQLS
jgi:hypothetical protein